MSTSSPNALFNRRLGIIITAAFLFGAGMSIIKGNAVGIRDAIGNVCAPWMLLPFVSVVLARKRQFIQASLVGFLASFCALIGFYFSNSFVLDLGPHPWLDKVGLTLGSGFFYYKLSILSGPIFGLLAAWYVRRKTCIPTILMALLFVLEPFEVFVYDFVGFRSYPILAIVEATIGILACAIFIIRCRFSRLG